MRQPPAPRNPVASALRDPRSGLRPAIVKPKRGRGAYSRKPRTQRQES